MIIQLMCTPLLMFSKGIIAVLSVLTFIPNSIVSTLDLILKAMQFFPADVWIMVIGNIVFWITLQLIWSIIHFVLRLVPFLNMRLKG